jgi:hypothetical protein
MFDNSDSVYSNQPDSGMFGKLADKLRGLNLDKQAKLPPDQQPPAADLNLGPVSDSKASGLTGELPIPSPDKITEITNRILMRRQEQMLEQKSPPQTLGAALEPTRKAPFSDDAAATCLKQTQLTDSSLFSLDQQDTPDISIEQIKLALVARQKSQTDLAIALGVTRFYVSKLFHGAKPLTPNLKRRCALVLSSWCA